MNFCIRRNCVRNSRLGVIIAMLLMAVLFVTNLLFGSVDIPASDVVSILSGRGCDNDVWRLIVLEMRLPQAVTALLAGAAISVAGLVLQTLFANPLAGPEVLGINSGAGLGVALVMLLSHGMFTVGGAALFGYVAMLAGAFAGALTIILIILFLSSLLRNRVFLLVAGVAVSYLTSSVISLLNYFATSEGVHSYLIWGMGSFSAVTLDRLPFFATVTLLLLFASLLMVKPLNVLLLGDAYAHNLGIRVRRVRTAALVVTGMLTAVVTAFCGPVAFVGLAVPHIARMLLSTNNHKTLLPATLFIGGATALLCNLICQLPGDGGLLPLGAVTPLIGAPVILYVVVKKM